MADIRSEIQEKLDKKCAKLLREGASDGIWTKEIFKALVKLGNNKGFYTCANAEGAKCGEWLYDLCWLKYNAKNENFEGVELALESEWGKEVDIIEDFQKIVQAKSIYKIMIFQLDSSDDDFINKLEETAMLLPGCYEEKYLLSCYVNQEGKFKHCNFVVPKCT